MKRCIFAFALFDIISQNLLSARSLVIIDVNALRRQLDHAPAHWSRRADDADGPSGSAHEFRPADYLRTAMSILHSYNDDDLEEVISSLRQELTQLKHSDNGLYNIFLSKISELLQKPTNEIKEQILTWMQALDNEALNELSLKLRSVNEMQAASELMNILKILDMYRYRSKKRSYDPMDAIKSSLRSAVNYVLGPEPATRAPVPLRDVFSVSPRTMRAMVEAVNFANKWISILAEKEKEESLHKIVRNVNLPEKEMKLLMQNLPNFDIN